MNDQVLSLLSENNLYEAITLLKQELKKKKDLNTLSSLEARLNSVNAQIHRGVLNQADAATEINRVRDGLLELARPSSEVAPASGNNPLILGGIGLLIVAILGGIGFYLFGDKTPESITCTTHKTAVLVADFQDKAQENHRDEFASDIVTKTDLLLGDTKYDVGGIGRVNRGRRYHETMRETHFNRMTNCDTSGILLNGILDIDKKIFDIWLTLSNLDMKVPELAERSTLALSNPVSVEFSMSEDADFISRFIYAVLKSAEGESLDALNQFYKLEQENEALINGNEALKTNLAFFKGNAYAIRGDDVRAKKQYEIASKSENPELRRAATDNQVTAERMHLEMLHDPETREIVNANIDAHSTYESDLARMINKASKDINTAGKQVGKAINNILGKKKRN